MKTKMTKKAQGNFSSLFCHIKKSPGGGISYFILNSVREKNEDELCNKFHEVDKN